MEPTPITRALPAPGPFWTFNREERNAVAVLFALLGRRGNLEAFANLLGWRPDDLAEAEVSVEWTYLRDLWNHHSRRLDSTALRAAILDCLQPDDRDVLAAGSILEFNTHFGAVPRPSAIYVQSPSNWSVKRFDTTIVGNDEFRRHAGSSGRSTSSPTSLFRRRADACSAWKRSGTRLRAPIRPPRQRRRSSDVASCHT